MSEADFCFDEGQYYADKAQLEHDIGPDSDKDKRIRNQRYEINCLKNRIKKLERRIENLERYKAKRMEEKCSTKSSTESPATSTR